MDHHSILLELTEHAGGQEESKSKTANLSNILSIVISLIPKELEQEIQQICENFEDTTTTGRYLQTILYVLASLHKNVLLCSETFMSVNEYRCVRSTLERAVSIGIFPCMIVQIRNGLKQIYPPVLTVSEDLNDLIKYNRLSSTVRTMVHLFTEISLRPAILTQLGPILGALVQLSCAPLAKQNSKTSEFQMTPELFEKLLNDQKEFKAILTDLFNRAPRAAVMKELMVLFGLENAPKWLKRNVKLYLINLIIEPTGIYSLIIATCQNDLDVGIHWERLDIISKLIATYQGKNPQKYYSAVCLQLLNLLSSRSVHYSLEIVKICIKTLHELHPDICQEKIINKIAEPLLVQIRASGNARVLKKEFEVSECVGNLTKLFTSTDCKFESLPVDLIKSIAVPLFSIYKKTYKSPLVLKLQSKALLLNLLTAEDLRNKLFCRFLNIDNLNDDFGKELSLQFGADAGLEITEHIAENNSEDTVDCLYDLVQNSDDLPLHLFNYLQRLFSEATLHYSRLDTPADVMKLMEKRLAVMRLLSVLANCKSVQESQLKNPETLLNFILTLFNKATTDQIENENDIEVLYVSLMLVKMILESKQLKNFKWLVFDHFSEFLTDKLIVLNNSRELSTLVEQVQTLIKKRGRTACFQDLSIDEKNESALDRALKDLADPILPVRAHGLISLTKLIETSNPVAISKPNLLLCIFQENINDEDSFIYLASINGLCALALKFPQAVIEILIQEFIDMPQRANSGEIAPETRAKLGEILVKTTRLLGGMASNYKNLLINGFLCGSRDSDPMVRASSLSCLAELCRVLGFALGNTVIEILYCIGCIIETDKAPECRRSAVLVINLLIRGLSRDVLVELGSELLPIYRTLKHLRDNDRDDVLRLHAQLALEELNAIVESLLLVSPKLDKISFLLK